MQAALHVFKYRNVFVNRKTLQICKATERIINARFAGDWQSCHGNDRCLWN
jgi:hypothetical protein